MFRLSDGRGLVWQGYGDNAGVPLFYLNGAGSSRLEAAYADAYARQLGLRLIAVDRPGFGRSSPTQEPGFQAFARDLLQLADALELERFGAIGMSAGGPHALHLAQLAGDRMRGVGLINASIDSSQPAWQATPGWLRLIARLSGVRSLLRPMVRGLKNDPQRFCARPARREGWSQAMVDQFVAAVVEGMRQDDAVDRMIDEAGRVLSQPWGLDWSALPCPVLALCGERDTGRWFYADQARRLANLRYVQIPGGHQPFAPQAAWQQIAELMAR